MVNCQSEESVIILMRLPYPIPQAIWELKTELWGGTLLMRRRQKNAVHAQQNTIYTWTEGRELI